MHEARLKTGEFWNSTEYTCGLLLPNDEDHVKYFVKNSLFTLSQKDLSFTTYGKCKHSF